jgi:hypothetical protein
LTVKPASSGQWAEAKRHQLFDFFRLAALASNARRSSPDISGSKLRMTPARPTTLGSDRVTPKFYCNFRSERPLADREASMRDPCRHDANAKLAGVICLR